MVHHSPKMLIKQRWHFIRPDALSGAIGFRAKETSDSKKTPVRAKFISSEIKLLCNIYVV